MAKTSSLNKQAKREKLVAKYAARRAELKRISSDMPLSAEERQGAREQLAERPRDSAPVRLRNRCVVRGRSRAVYHEFMLSRIAFREMALAGELPGVHKASW